MKTKLHFFLEFLTKLSDNKMTEREEKVIIDLLVYNKTLQEIADDLDLTSQRVNQIFFATFRRLFNLEQKLKEISLLEEEKQKLLSDIYFLKIDKIEVTEKMKSKDKTNLNIFDLKITELNMSLRAMNCMNRAGLYKLGDIYEYIVKNGKNSLINFRNFGKKTLNEIEKVFKDFNIIIDY